MLGNFLEANRALFSTLADTWLNSDTVMFSVWMDHRLLVCWPPSARNVEPCLVEDILIKGKKIGELRVAGKCDAATASRLRMDASFLSNLAAQETDMGAMASELIDTRDQLVALYNLTQTTGTSLDLDQSLVYLSYETYDLTQSLAAFIAVKLEGAPAHITYHPHQLLEDHCIVAYLEDLKSDERDFIFIENSQTGDPCEEQNLLILPYKVRGVEIAAIGIHTKVGRSALSPVIKLLRTIAEYAGAHIQNMLMVQESMRLNKLEVEMELARNVQISLLPTHTPLITGLDIWADSRPASVVGGDFYDFIERSGKPLTFTVGDISGKGMPASLPMAMTRTVIRSQVNAYQLPTPQNILRSSNAALYEDFNQLGVFATVFIGQYNRSGNELLFANAGHSPVIYCPNKGRAQLIEASDIPVGMLPGTPFENHLLRLSPNDVLVVGTDGLYEVRNGQDQLLGYDCLIDQVVSLSHGTAKEIAVGILDSIANYRGAQAQEDDQTLIVIKRTYP
jgi:phosphoserine phosphatase RsbU/P